jgi:hypothetical protein
MLTKNERTTSEIHRSEAQIRRNPNTGILSFIKIETE